MTGLGDVHTLIVDDNRQMRQLLREMLRGLGLRKVEEASDGMSALEVMRDVPIDLVLADWQMQPLDGLEFVRLLRSAKDSPNPYCSIVMVTGHASRDLVRQARDAGVSSFLVKPLSVRSLKQHLVAVINDDRPFIKTPGYIGPDRRRGQDLDYSGPLRRSEDQARAAKRSRS